MRLRYRNSYHRLAWMCVQFERYWKFISIIILFMHCPSIHAEPPKPDIILQRLIDYWRSNQLSELEFYVNNLYSDHPSYVPAMIASAFVENIYKGDYSTQESRMLEVLDIIEQNPQLYPKQLRSSVEIYLSELRYERQAYLDRGFTLEQISENANPQAYYQMLYLEDQSFPDEFVILSHYPGALAMNVPISEEMEVYIKFVLVDPGPFEMGCMNDQSWNENPNSTQPIRMPIFRHFYHLSQTPITEEQWAAIMGEPPVRGALYPKVDVSWDDCQEFIRRLNTLNQGYFWLPSETQWEGACRVESDTRFFFGDSDCSPTECTPCDLDDYAWWCGNNSPQGPKPVGQRIPNAFGLYDMHGNVWEWCEDYWHDSYQSAPEDDRAWIENPTDTRRVIRGGSFDEPARNCRAATRKGAYPDHSSEKIGFRVAWYPAPIWEISDNGEPVLSVDQYGVLYMHPRLSLEEMPQMEISNWVHSPDITILWSIGVRESEGEVDYQLLLAKMPFGQYALISDNGFYDILSKIIRASPDALFQVKSGNGGVCLQVCADGKFIHFYRTRFKFSQ